MPACRINFYNKIFSIYIGIYKAINIFQFV